MQMIKLYWGNKLKNRRIQIASVILIVETGKWLAAVTTLMRHSNYRLKDIINNASIG